METYKGNLATCLGHFLRHVDEADKKEKDSFIKFVGIKNRTTVRRWKNGDGKPTGLVYIKILFYLGHRNYEIAEFNSAPAKVREAAQGVIDILALNIVTLPQAAEEIGYKYDYDLTGVLVGRNNPSNKAVLGMKDFYSRHRLEALDAMRKFLGKSEIPVEKIKTAAEKVKGSPEKNATQKVKKEAPPILFGGDQLTADLIRLLGSNSAYLEPLLDYYIYEASDAERQNLHNEIEKGGRTLFKISNSFYRVAEKLNALCTDKMLETYKQKNQKK